MGDIKWIKIVTDIFDDEKILLIETLPEADSIIVIWFKLLCLAGKQNNSGVFILNDKMPYSEKMFATIFRRKESTVQLALNTFEQFGMIEIINDTVTIPNWSKHQSLDQLEQRNEYMKNYMKSYREKQKELASGECKVNSKVNSKSNVSEADKIRRDIDKNNILPNGSTSEQSPDMVDDVVRFYNLHHNRMPEAKTLSRGRKGYINARLDKYGIEQVKEVILKAEKSEFLNGGGDKGWIAGGIDWIMRPENFPKVLEGKYDNRDKCSAIDQPNQKEMEYERAKHKADEMLRKEGIILE